MTDLEKRHDRFTLICVVIIPIIGLVAAIIAFYLNKPNEERRKADAIELAQWRDAAKVCTAMHRMHFDQWEAACYKQEFSRGASLSRAVEQCHGVIMQCDTTTALQSIH